MAENGASLSTIDAKLQFPPNTLAKLIEKGKSSKESRDPYRKFYMMFRSWASEAKFMAETIMAKKSPEKWLDRNTTSKVIESEEDRQLAIEAPSNESTGNLPNKQNSDQLLEALKTLRESGIDINDAIDKRQITIEGEVNHEENDL